MTEILKKKDFREQLFAREYLLDLNGTKPAIAAGFSPKTAAQAGSRLLRKVKVWGIFRQIWKDLRDRAENHGTELEP